MDFFDVVDTRRTVRDFLPEEIPEADIRRIVAAAMKAPTNDHMRDWHYIVIRDKRVVMKLLDIIPKGISEEDMAALLVDWHLSDPEQQLCYRNAVPKQHRMLAEASVVVVPLLQQKMDIMHPENLSALNGFASIWCSIENIFLAATALGYGCNLRIPLGDEAQWSREVLGYPEKYFMPCFIGIGVPDPEAKAVKQKDIDLEDRIHWDTWSGNDR